MDISVAHVIETVRLAQVTAALRNLPAPSLAEFNEAITTVMGFGDDILLQIIKEELIISNRLGRVPDDVPKVPLLVDVEKTQKRLRVPFTAEIKELTLDLRKPNDLDRSIFFHRLHLLDIDWAIPGGTDGKGYFQRKMDTLPQAGTDYKHHRKGYLGKYTGRSNAEVSAQTDERDTAYSGTHPAARPGNPCQSTGLSGGHDGATRPPLGCLH